MHFSIYDTHLPSVSFELEAMKALADYPKAFLKRTSAFLGTNNSRRFRRYFELPLLVSGNCGRGMNIQEMRRLESVGGGRDGRGNKKPARCRRDRFGSGGIFSPKSGSF